MLLYSLAIVFGIFLFIDIFGHFWAKIKRNSMDWFIFFSVFVLAAVFFAAGMSDSKNVRDDKNELYIGYRYIQDGNPELAKVNLDMVVGEYKIQAQILNIIADVENKDYSFAYFKAIQLKNENARLLEKKDRQCLADIATLCQKKMQEESVDDGEILESIKVIADNYIFGLNFDDKTKEELENEYQIDKQINLQKDLMNELIDKNGIDYYENSERGLRFLCKYYEENNDYEKACKYAKELIKKYENEENYIIYADINGQIAYRKNDNETLLRIVNYLLAKESSLNSRSGLFEFEIAKLYYIAGREELADKYIDTVFESSLDIDQKSIIKNAIDEVVNENNKINYTKDSFQFEQALKKLFYEQSSNIIENKYSTINGKFYSYLKSKLINKDSKNENIDVTENSDENDENIDKKTDENNNDEAIYEDTILMIDAEIDQEAFENAPKEENYIYYENDNTLTNDKLVEAYVVLEEGSKAEAYLNDKLVIKSINENSKLEIYLKEGINIIKFQIEDEHGYKKTDERIVTLDTMPPSLEISKTINNVLTSDNYIYICGKTDNDANIRINGDVVKSENGYFNERLILDLGNNEINLVVEDQAGNQNMYSAIVDYELNRDRRFSIYGLLVSSIILGVVYIIRFTRGAKRRK